ncbi:hypothetical protein ABZY45_23915 [Streptomyces sp. NPDC006516]|uniref:hypothetical protein n=1 Tax=Streptomyces sp. NPDC006516 TaxID=3154309 RepID=UPI0033B1E0DC
MYPPQAVGALLVRDAAAVSDRVVEKRAFSVTDLGEFARVHLTHTPRPGAGAPARQAHEATGTEGLAGRA